MKNWKRVLTIIGSVMVVTLVIVANAWAFSMGNVDGVWTTIDSGGGASSDAWATGPVGGSTNYDIPTSTSGTNPGIQGALGGTDWNQVRYGTPWNTTNSFGNQSGFGFDGVNNVDEGADGVLAQDEIFLIGKWCHFNNPINSPDNPFGYVDLDVQVDTVRCPDATIPSPDGIMNISYRFGLDETTNTGVSTQPQCGYESVYGSYQMTYECPYTVGSDNICPFDDTGVNANGCADEVTIGATSVSDEFTCTYGDAHTDYTIYILGFVPVASTSQCPTTVAAGQATSTTYISREAGDSCGCLYGKVTEATGTAVELASFSAAAAGESVLIRWETVSELDNLGFLLYRETEGISGWTSLNEELIPSLVNPGAPFGAAYEFTDADVAPGTAYNYWLMDVDLDGTAKLHGPVEVVMP